MTIRKQYNTVIGVDYDGNLVMLNELFAHGLHDGKPFQGATGATLAPINQNMVDDRNEVDPDEFDYLWREAVAAKRTELSLKDYIDEVVEQSIDESDGLFFGHDTSFCGYVDLDEIKAKIKALAEENNFDETAYDDVIGLECIGCGRMFSRETPLKLHIVFEPELVALIYKWETTEIDMSLVEENQVS